MKSEYLTAGWVCCICTGYNGLQRATCSRGCQSRCSPLKPTSSGEHFETYKEAYANEPALLAAYEQAYADANGPLRAPSLLARRAEDALTALAEVGDQLPHDAASPSTALLHSVCSRLRELAKVLRLAREARAAT